MPEVYCIIPVFLIVPTLAARCLSLPQPAVAPLEATGGTMGGNSGQIIPGICTQGSLTCLKSLPKEGVLRIFIALKNPMALAGFEPANLGIRGQHATSAPPNPLQIPATSKEIYTFHTSRLENIGNNNNNNISQFTENNRYKCFSTLIIQCCNTFH
jgi:hypothetical protein